MRPSVLPRIWATGTTLLLAVPVLGTAAPSVHAQTATPAPISLTGEWVDNGHPLSIVQSGAAVTATYDQPRVCDFEDDSGGSQTYDLDFQGTLAGNQITGSTSTCRYGKDNPGGLGVFPADMQLTVSADGSSLTGTWQGVGPQSMSLTRASGTPTPTSSAGATPSPAAPGTPAANASCSDLQNQLSSVNQELGSLGSQMDLQLQSVAADLIAAASQAGGLPGAQGQLAQTQLIGAANDLLALRQALENEGPGTFFDDPDWNQIMLRDVGLVQADFQMTAGYQVAVPFQAMNDLGQSMSQGLIDAQANDNVTNQMDAQGCAPGQPAGSSDGVDSSG